MKPQSIRRLQQDQRRRAVIEARLAAGRAVHAVDGLMAAIRSVAEPSVRMIPELDDCQCPRCRARRAAYVQAGDKPTVQ